MNYSPISMKILYMKNAMVINKHFLVFPFNMKKKWFTPEKKGKFRLKYHLSQFFFLVNSNNNNLSKNK